MKSKILVLISVVLLGVCGVASANIIYSVDISGGGETVKGTITTDGHAGPLVAADFVSWSLTASGGVNFVDVGPPPGANCGGLGCGVVAVGGDLEFNGGFGTFLSLADSADDLLGFSQSAVGVLQPIVQILIPETAPYVIGRASVPEPPTAILLVLALAGLGFARRKR